MIVFFNSSRTNQACLERKSPFGFGRKLEECSTNFRNRYICNPFVSYFIQVSWLLQRFLVEGPALLLLK